ncbi:hypothetical protein RND71_007185 [Anisodus tanguticus]|uniref:Uncharacterized protein n=1 Tax=Anisodus tanguticus TaxID=243964 RepID=A0AAE1VPI8_9SOLA|nr:hypothetical protein RND71_007185 [Anisodus tanguticus]
MSYRWRLILVVLDCGLGKSFTIGDLRKILFQLRTILGGWRKWLGWNILGVLEQRWSVAAHELKHVSHRP